MAGVLHNPPLPLIRVYYLSLWARFVCLENAPELADTVASFSKADLTFFGGISHWRGRPPVLH